MRAATKRCQWSVERLTGQSRRCVTTSSLSFTMRHMSNWKQELQRVATQAKAEVVGISRIDHFYHAALVKVAIEAFGDNPGATFYIEGKPPAGGIPRPDLIILHPDIGVLVIENKGVDLGEILNVHHTLLTLLRNGIPKEEDPFKQADNVMFGIKDLCKKHFDLRHALFLSTVAFPRIRRDEFELRFKTRLLPETLFADCCADKHAFRERVLAQVNAEQRIAYRTERLNRFAHKAIMNILDGGGLFHAPRRTYIDDSDPNLLGVQIQELELTLKEATQQQKEFGKSDMRGSHRLFRGVAGSGKSIMLALSVSQTLVKFAEETSGLFGGNQPSRRILVVCFNRTLVHYLRSKIEVGYGRMALEAPPEDMLKITHFEGLVRDIESKHPSLATGLTYEKKEERAKALSAAFDKLDAATKESLLFDAIYVDESQDLIPAEFEFLLRLARKEKDDKQTFILFYDNAQNIYGVTPPTWEKLGINIKGARTVFLDQCLRNTTQTLAFAFNVLVGSFAPEGQRVATRQFADVASLKQRGLISENGDRYDIHFSPRTGPTPVVKAYPHRNAEIDGIAEVIKELVTTQKVLPSDILILYKSHYSFKDRLPQRLQAAIGDGCKLHFVDNDHPANKNVTLVEDGYLTISTIASAKGYDAPIVFLLGADELETNPQGRASFYVGASRAKFLLYVSGVKVAKPGLLDEIMLAGKAMAAPKIGVPPVVVSKPAMVAPPIVAATIARKSVTKRVCRHCKSEKLHAQHGRFGYFFRCIDCTENTPIDTLCPNCGNKGRIRKDELEFFLECEPCGYSELVHRNVPLESL